VVNSSQGGGTKDTWVVDVPTVHQTQSIQQAQQQQQSAAIFI
jgi:uncharacterized circularly permuted ATP-grasp superfamily protein